MGQVAALEAEYLTLRQELAEFRIRWARRFAPLYAQLDRIEAEIARLEARQEPGPEATRRAQEARERAERSERVAGDAIVEPEPAPRPPPTASLRKAYRSAAFDHHPDRATDEDDRKRRTVVMARLNDAYEAGDLATIERIVEEATQERTDRPEAPGHATAEIRVLERQISQVSARILELESLLRELRSGPHYTLYQLELDARPGDDPFAYDEAELRSRISKATVRLRELVWAAV